MRKEFWVLVCIIVINTFLYNSFFLSSNVYFNSYADRLTYEQIQLFLNESKRWEWITYLLIPIIYFVKFSLISLCLVIVLFISNNRFEWNRLFTVGVKAEFVFLIPLVIKLFWFLFIQTNYTLQEFQYFYPLSALNVFNAESLAPWLIYPLQVLNLFEVIYWVVLAYLLSKELPDLDMNRSMTVVMSGYGTGLVIWIAFVMFLTLTYT